jgi:hypothetical protein
MDSLKGAGQGPKRPYIVILGTNEVASAIAIVLHRAGGRVVLAHDPVPPVLRRSRSFHDALFGDPSVLDGVAAERADTTVEARALMTGGSGVIVTALGVLDLIALDRLDILIDARLQSTTARPDLRWLARTSVGLGAGFQAAANCDIAVDLPDPPADAEEGRAVRSPVRGVWRTPVEIGAYIFKDFTLGHLDGVAIRAPMDGVIAGAVRDGTEVMSGVDLVEIDRRAREIQWRGVDVRGQAIAGVVLAAIEAPLAVHAPRPRVGASSA